MPTVSSATHKAGATNPELNVHKGFELRLVEVFDGERLRSEWYDILDIVAAHDLVLASGHLSIDETVRLFGEAAKRGINRLLVNHPKMPFLGWHDEAAADLRRLGAHLELGILPDLLGPPDQHQRRSGRRIPARAAGVRRRPRPRPLPGPGHRRPPLAARAGTAGRAGCRPLHPDHQRTKATPTMTHIALLPGDGVGAEILDGPRHLPAAAGRRGRTDHPHRPDAIRQHGLATDR